MVEKKNPDILFPVDVYNLVFSVLKLSESEICVCLYKFKMD